MIPTAAALSAEIIRQASLYENLLETRPNREWDNPSTPEAERALSRQLTEVMESAGWEAPWAYCIAFAEGMVILALRRLGCLPAQYAAFRRLITPHVMTSVRNLSDRKLLSERPEPGAIWMARHGTTDQGHAGIVVRFPMNGLMIRFPANGLITTIEGNTSSTYQGPEKDRQGDGIFRRERNLITNGDLRTQGFLTPDTIVNHLLSAA